jgi:hypothetical protein
VAGLPAARLDGALPQAVREGLVFPSGWGSDLRLGGASFPPATADAERREERAPSSNQPADFWVTVEQVAGALALEKRTRKPAFTDALDLVFDEIDLTSLSGDRFANEPDRVE